MSLAELLQRSDVTSEKLPIEGSVRVGGPVSPEQVWLVYKAEDRFEGLEGQFEVGEGIIASASRKVLESIVETGSARSVIGLVGYAGWAPSQLEDEIRVGAWLPTDVAVSLVFEVPCEETWQRAYEFVGTSPIAFTGRTIGSA